MHEMTGVSGVLSFLPGILGQTLMISGFVFVMMLVIEYLNVLTRGNWDRVVARWRWGQSAFGALLGATPGCLGAFAVDSLYIHRILTHGSLVAAMIATCGDEAFVMLALFPGKALIIFAVLFVLGLVTGIVVDLLLKAGRVRTNEHIEQYRAAHTDTDECIHFSRKEIVRQWRHCSPQRGWLTFLLVLFVAGVLLGAVGHDHPVGVHAPGPQIEHVDHDLETEHGVEHAESDWNWVRVTLLLAGIIGLLIVATVPEHFLDEHLWNHLVKVHAWRIFLWTFFALIVTHVMIKELDLNALIAAHKLPILLIACLIGIIPESGPHLVFVTLYVQGAIPFSTLLASCIVQDGHGMIPILAHSRLVFFSVKAVNLTLGLLVGLLGLWMGW